MKLITFKNNKELRRDDCDLKESFKVCGSFNLKGVKCF